MDESSNQQYSGVFNETQKERVKPFIRTVAFFLVFCMFYQDVISAAGPDYASTLKSSYQKPINVPKKNVLLSLLSGAGSLVLGQNAYAADPNDQTDTSNSNNNGWVRTGSTTSTSGVTTTTYTHPQTGYNAATYSNNPGQFAMQSPGGAWGVYNRSSFNTGSTPVATYGQNGWNPSASYSNPAASRPTTYIVDPINNPFGSDIPLIYQRTPQGVKVAEMGAMNDIEQIGKDNFSIVTGQGSHLQGLQDGSKNMIKNYGPGVAPNLKNESFGNRQIGDDNLMVGRTIQDNWQQGSGNRMITQGALTGNRQIGNGNIMAGRYSITNNIQQGNNNLMHSLQGNISGNLQIGNMNNMMSKLNITNNLQLGNNNIMHSTQGSIINNRQIGDFNKMYAMHNITNNLQQGNKNIMQSYQGALTNNQQIGNLNKMYAMHNVTGNLQRGNENLMHSLQGSLIKNQQIGNLNTMYAMHSITNNLQQGNNNLMHSMQGALTNNQQIGNFNKMYAMHNISDNLQRGNNNIMESMKGSIINNRQIGDFNKMIAMHNITNNLQQGNNNLMRSMQGSLTDNRQIGDLNKMIAKYDITNNLQEGNNNLMHSLDGFIKDNRQIGNGNQITAQKNIISNFQRGDNNIMKSLQGSITNNWQIGHGNQMIAQKDISFNYQNGNNNIMQSHQGSIIGNQQIGSDNQMIAQKDIINNLQSGNNSFMQSLQGALKGNQQIGDLNRMVAKYDVSKNLQDGDKNVMESAKGSIGESKQTGDNNQKIAENDIFKNYQKSSTTSTKPAAIPKEELPPWIQSADREKAIAEAEKTPAVSEQAVKPGERGARGLGDGTGNGEGQKPPKTDKEKAAAVKSDKTERPAAQEERKKTVTPEGAQPAAVPAGAPILPTAAPGAVPTGGRNPVPPDKSKGDKAPTQQQGDAQPGGTGKPDSGPAPAELPPRPGDVIVPQANIQGGLRQVETPIDQALESAPGRGPPEVNPQNIDLNKVIPGFEYKGVTDVQREDGTQGQVATFKNPKTGEVLVFHLDDAGNVRKDGYSYSSDNRVWVWIPSDPKADARYTLDGGKTWFTRSSDGTVKRETPLVLDDSARNLWVGAAQKGQAPEGSGVKVVRARGDDPIGNPGDLNRAIYNYRNGSEGTAVLVVRGESVSEGGIAASADHVDVRPGDQLIIGGKTVHEKQADGSTRTRVEGGEVITVGRVFVDKKTDTVSFTFNEDGQRRADSTLYVIGVAKETPSVGSPVILPLRERSDISNVPGAAARIDHGEAEDKPAAGVVNTPAKVVTGQVTGQGRSLYTAQIAGAEKGHSGSALLSVDQEGYVVISGIVVQAAFNGVNVEPRDPYAGDMERGITGEENPMLTAGITPGMTPEQRAERLQYNKDLMVYLGVHYGERIPVSELQGVSVKAGSPQAVRDEIAGLGTVRGQDLQSVSVPVVQMAQPNPVVKSDVPQANSTVPASSSTPTPPTRPETPPTRDAGTVVLRPGEAQQPQPSRLDQTKPGQNPQFETKVNPPSAGDMYDRLNRPTNEDVLAQAHSAARRDGESMLGPDMYVKDGRIYVQGWTPGNIVASVNGAMQNPDGTIDWGETPGPAVFGKGGYVDDLAASQLEAKRPHTDPNVVRLSTGADAKAGTVLVPGQGDNAGYPVPIGQITPEKAGKTSNNPGFYFGMAPSKEMYDRSITEGQNDPLVHFGAMSGLDATSASLGRQLIAAEAAV